MAYGLLYDYLNGQCIERTITSAATAGLNVASGGVQILGSAQKTGYLFHRFISNVQAGKFALQVGRYSVISLNKSLNKVGLNGTMRPDVIAVGSHGIRVVEVVSRTQSIESQLYKIAKIGFSNPGIIGEVINWIFGGWFFL